MAILPSLASVKLPIARNRSQKSSKALRLLISTIRGFRECIRATLTCLNRLSQVPLLGLQSSRLTVEPNRYSELSLTPKNVPSWFQPISGPPNVDCVLTRPYLCFCETCLSEFARRRLGVVIMTHRHLRRQSGLRLWSAAEVEQVGAEATDR